MRAKRLILLAVIIATALGGGVFVNASTDLLIQAESYKAAIVSPTSLTFSGKAGDSVDISMRIKNTGSATWTHTEPGAVKIGTSSPRDDENSRFYNTVWLSKNRVATFKENSVVPGDTGTFDFKVTISSGTRTENFELVSEGVAWFENSVFAITLQGTQGVYSYSWVGQSPPVKVMAGSELDMWVEIKNTGNVTWQKDGTVPVRLGTDRPTDRKSALRHPNWIQDNRVVGLPNNVAPNETVRLNFKALAPAKAAIYKEYFNLVAENITWMPSLGIYWQVEVQPATYSAAFVGQAPYPTLTPGSTADLWVELRNTGNVTWNAATANAAKLGTSVPLDRGSIFYDSSWPATNRVAVVSPAQVAPGEIGKFNFKIHAPDKTGVYKEYFRPLIENVTWMNDLGIYFQIEVAQEVVITNPIRVGLTPIESPVTVTASSYAVRQGDTLLKRTSGATTLTVSGNSYQLRFADGQTLTAAAPLKFLPTNDAILEVSASGVSSKYDQFRGLIQIDRSNFSGRHWIVNVLGMEDYLKGIAEVPNSWPLEAQKAQMVAARTYASKLRLGPVADIFDLYSDPRSQAYEGYVYEQSTPSLTQAVNETAGLTIKYSGQLASTYYHSDSGGATASVFEVWGEGNPARGIPYLISVQDPYALPYTWTATLTEAYLQDRFDEQLAAAGALGEGITSIDITKRFSSNRVEEAVFNMSSGKRVAMTFTTLDYLLPNTDVKSMNFTVRKDGSNFIFEGLGNGHGVGLSQYSAKKMAEQGKSFREILTFFYTGVSIEAN